MRSYQADLSRRLGPVFAEYAAQPKTTSDRNLPATREVQVVQAMPRPSQAAAYKPTHGGYPSAYPAEGARSTGIDDSVLLPYLKAFIPRHPEHGRNAVARKLGISANAVQLAWDRLRASSAYPAEGARA